MLHAIPDEFAIAPGPVAALRLSGDSLVPALVSHILSVQPDRSAAHGGALARSTGWNEPARTGLWFIDTRDKGLASRDPARHLAWVIGLFGSPARAPESMPRWRELRLAMAGLHADLLLMVHDELFDPIQLPAELVRTATSFAELWIETPLQYVVWGQHAA